MKTYGYIYMTTNKVNNHRYIGQRAWSDPDKKDSYIGSGKAFLNAVKKYGRKNFSKEILQWASSKEELDELEKSFIKKYDAVNSPDFYNIQEGGGSWGVGQLAGERNPFYGKHHTEETKQKIKENLPDQSGENNPNYGNRWSEEKKTAFSEATTGRYVGENNPNYGNRWTDEQRKHMSETMKGRNAGELSPFYGKHPSEETRRKMSEAQKKHAQENPWTDEQRAQASQRNKGENNPMYGKGYKLTGEQNGMYGKKHSEEAKRKMRESHKDVSGKNNPMYGKCPTPKGVVKLDLDMNVVAEYRSIGQAAKENGCYPAGITKSCKKGTLYREHYWKYEEEIR